MCFLVMLDLDKSLPCYSIASYDSFINYIPLLKHFISSKCFCNLDFLQKLKYRLFIQMKNCNGTFISLNAFSYRFIVLNFITIKHSWYQQIFFITIELFCQ